MDIANCTLLTVPTVLLFGCGYMLRWNAIPRYLLWCVLLTISFYQTSTQPVRKRAAQASGL